MAQESGTDWKIEKLQKYLSASRVFKLRISSGINFSRVPSFSILRQIPQKIFSDIARLSREIIPMRNWFCASSFKCTASCQDSFKFLFEVESRTWKISFTTSGASSSILILSLHSGKLVTPSTLTTSIEW